MPGKLIFGDWKPNWVKPSLLEYKIDIKFQLAFHIPLPSVNSKIVLHLLNRIYLMLIKATKYRTCQNINSLLKSGYLNLIGSWLSLLSTSRPCAPLREQVQPVATKTDDEFIVDISANYQLNNDSQIDPTLDNALDEQVIVASRSFGARPGKLQSLTVGYKLVF